MDYGVCKDEGIWDPRLVFSCTLSEIKYQAELLVVARVPARKGTCFVCMLLIKKV